MCVCAGTVMGAHSEHPEYSPDIHVQNRFITLYRYTSVNTLLVTKLDAFKIYLFRVTLFVIAYHIFFEKHPKYNSLVIAFYTICN